MNQQIRMVPADQWSVYGLACNLRFDGWVTGRDKRAEVERHRQLVPSRRVARASRTAGVYHHAWGGAAPRTDDEVHADVWV